MAIKDQRSVVARFSPVLESVTVERDPLLGQEVASLEEHHPPSG